MTIAAEHFLPTDASQIPTGELRPVAGTPFDFRTPTPVGARIHQAEEQLLRGGGYDHCWVLAREARPGQVRLAARVRDPGTGRVLEVHSDQPGLQFYSGNKLDGSVAGRGGVTLRQGAGLALEAQDFPDAPHHPGFPSIVLRPGETYARTIRYHFSVES
jgi:aldose 1-epimerase